MVQGPNYIKKDLIDPTASGLVKETIILQSRLPTGQPYRLVSRSYFNCSPDTTHGSRERLCDDLGVEHTPYTLRLESKMRYMLTDSNTYTIPVFRLYSLFKQPLYRGHSWRLDRVLRRLKDYPDMLEKFMLYHYNYK